MAVAGSDMKLFLPATVATSFSTSSVGGAVSATEATGAVGEVLFSMSSAASSGGDAVQYAKIFDVNDHATDQVDSYGVWVANGIDDLSVASQITLVSDSASDGSSVTARFIGKNNSGAAITEDLTMNGTSSVQSTLSYVDEVRIEFRATSGLALTNTTGNVTITHNSTTVGVHPAGAESSNSEISIGLASALDDSATIADASTAPGGVSFTRPRTSASKLTVDGGTGTMEAGESQGIWLRWTVPELQNPSQRVRTYISGEGDAV